MLYHHYSLRQYSQVLLSKMDNLYLEKKLESWAVDFKDKFPVMGVNYFERYKGIVGVLETNYYPRINEGLSAKSAKPGGVYTSHGPEHFKEVVKFAGYLLDESIDENSIYPYELYLLLVAIRIHDVGNMYGREEHEKKCFKILKDIGSIAGDDNRELRIIADIAESHGGYSKNGSKDTISDLQEGITTYASIDYRPRLIASIVRIADEICELPDRAATQLLKDGEIPRVNEIYHYYAVSILSIKPKLSEQSIDITYSINVNYLENPVGKDDGEAYLHDEIFKRLDKMHLERSYCSRFMGDYSYNKIRATIQVDEEDDTGQIETLWKEEFTLKDEGYPSNEKSPLFEDERIRNIEGSRFWNRLKGDDNE